MTGYQQEIARACDSPRLSPSQLRELQREMWARHRIAEWQGADIGTLHAGMVGTRARTQEWSV